MLSQLLNAVHTYKSAILSTENLQLEQNLSAIQTNSLSGLLF